MEKSTQVPTERAASVVKPKLSGSAKRKRKAERKRALNHAQRASLDTPKREYSFRSGNRLPEVTNGGSSRNQAHLTNGPARNAGYPGGSSELYGRKQDGRMDQGPEAGGGTTGHGHTGSSGYSVDAGVDGLSGARPRKVVFSDGRERSIPKNCGGGAGRSGNLRTHKDWMELKRLKAWIADQEAKIAKQNPTPGGDPEDHHGTSDAPI